MASISIRLTDLERDTGDLSPQHLFNAVECILREGVVIVENAIPVPVIDKLNERMLVDTERLLKGEGGNVALYK